jgi:hypothetical protein
LIYSFPQKRNASTLAPEAATPVVAFYAADSVVITTTTPPTQGVVTDTTVATDN